MEGQRPRRAWWVLAFCLTLLVVSGISTLTYLGAVRAFWNTESHLDLWMHGLLTGLLAFFLNGTLGGRTVAIRRGISVNLAAMIILGAAGLEELAQMLSARRTSSIADYLADAAGVVLFIGIARALRRFRRQEAGGRRQETGNEK